MTKPPLPGLDCSVRKQSPLIEELFSLTRRSHLCRVRLEELDALQSLTMHVSGAKKFRCISVHTCRHFDCCRLYACWLEAVLCCHDHQSTASQERNPNKIGRYFRLSLFSSYLRCVPKNAEIVKIQGFELQSQLKLQAVRVYQFSTRLGRGKDPLESRGFETCGYTGREKYFC